MQVVVLGRTVEAASIAVIEQGVSEDRRCLRCDNSSPISMNRLRGLQSRVCESGDQTFDAAKWTPLSGLHRKVRCLSFQASLSRSETAKTTVDHCQFATYHRWNRFLTAVEISLEASAYDELMQTVTPAFNPLI